MKAKMWQFLAAGIFIAVGWAYFRGHAIDSTDFIMMIMASTFAEAFGQIEELRKRSA